MNNEHPYERYQRQILLKELGIAGQQKMLSAKVLVIGAGGLGCPVLQYLAAAGIGDIGIVDDDVVSLNNLHRQLLYTVNDIGLLKAETAKEKLRQLNPEISITAYTERFTVNNALPIIEKYHIVIDGTDNFATRYLVNDACVLLNRPLVYGAVSRFEGQVAVFNCNGKDTGVGVNYRDLFPQPPKDGEVLNCSETGVLGVLPGVIGTLMASETIKLITGIGTALTNRMLTFNVFTNRFYELAVQPRAGTSLLIPGSIAAFQQMNYEWLCAAPTQFEIDVTLFDRWCNDIDAEIIDVREPGEQPAVDEFQHKQIPLSQFKAAMPVLYANTIVLFCQSGKRSLQAAQWLFEVHGTSKKIYSLQGGILQWKKQRQTQNT
jgi:sulfur-carrier protein adenylyltransferase/sulfurtransferase